MANLPKIRAYCLPAAHEAAARFEIAAKMPNNRHDFCVAVHDDHPRALVVTSHSACGTRSTIVLEDAIDAAEANGTLGLLLKSHLDKVFRPQ